MKTLILDLDETLIHTRKNLDNNKDSYDFTIDLDGSEYFVSKRPYLDKFLEFAKKDFNIIIWTSASRDYAEAILDKITPHSFPLEARELCRTHQIFNLNILDDLYSTQKKSLLKNLLTTQKFWGLKADDFFGDYGVFYTKPLKNIIKKYKLELKNIICLDDSPYKFYENYANCWYVKPYFGGTSDNFLLNLIIHLNEIRKLDDVRTDKTSYKKLFL